MVIDLEIGGFHASNDVVCFYVQRTNNKVNDRLVLSANNKDFVYFDCSLT